MCDFIEPRLETLTYKLPNGKLWDVAKADYVETAAEGKVVVFLQSSEKGKDPEQYLDETLHFYKFPLGKFKKPEDDQTLEERIKSLEDQLKVFQTAQKEEDGGGV